MNAITISDSHYECPECGEVYISPYWWRQHGKTVTMTCNGEDGCGKDFSATYSDPEEVEKDKA